MLNTWLSGGGSYGKSFMRDILRLIRFLIDKLSM